MGMAVVTLKKGEGKLLKSGGMWIFDNEIDTVMGNFENKYACPSKVFPRTGFGHKCLDKEINRPHHKCMAINVPRGRTPHQNNIVTGAKQNGGNKGITLITHHLHSREVEEGNQQDGCKTCHRTLKSQIVGRNHLRHCSQPRR